MTHRLTSHLLVAVVAILSSQPRAVALDRSSAIEAPGPSGPLSGTLLDVGDPAAPTVLIIPGSGPTDRDGNSPLGIKAATYRLLAEGLAAHGIRTVRIDKRGLFGSAHAVADGNAVTMADYADDVRGWIATIRARTGVRCVWLLGHSEGGLVALATAQRADGICGLLLVATPGRRLGDVLREQIRANPANEPIREQAEDIIGHLEAGDRVSPDKIHPALMPLFRPEVQGFLMGTMALDPVKLAASYAGPALVLQGLRDIQIGQADAERLHKAHAGSELVLVPSANHVLKFVGSDDRSANITTYRDPDRPLVEGIVDALAAFVKRPGNVR